MNRQPTYSLISQYVDFTALSQLLEEREGLRRVYATLQDAHHVTGNSAFFQLAGLCAAAGADVNNDIAILLRKVNAEHAGDDFNGVGQPHDEK